MKKALLTGSTGLLGSALKRKLAERGLEIIAPKRRDGLLWDINYLRKLMEENKVDVIFNTAAYTAVDDAEENFTEASLLNTISPALLATVIRDYPKTRLIHFSTDFIFSGEKVKVLLEEDPGAPLNVYGSTKLDGEKLLLKILPDRSLVIRTAWLFGHGRKNFVDTILKLAAERDEIKVVNDQKGSPTYAEDLAEWAIMLAEKNAAGLFHGVNSGMASWHELAREAVALAGFACKVLPISSSEWTQKAQRPMFSVLDNSKLSKALGQPPRHWKDALNDYIRTRKA